MAFNVNEFRAQMVADGARPNLFSVTLNFPQLLGRQVASRKLTFMANSTQLPPSIVGVARQSYFGREVKFPGDRIFPDWSINIVNDEDFAIRDAFEAWSNTINSHNFNIRNPVAINSLGYAVDASVTQYSKIGAPIKTYYFYGLFPTQVDPINVAWNQNDTIEEFGVTLSYQYWTNDATLI
jgi:hypothetical protein